MVLSPPIVQVDIIYVMNAVGRRRGVIGPAQNRRIHQNPKLGELGIPRAILRKGFEAVIYHTKCIEMGGNFHIHNKVLNIYGIYMVLIWC